MGRHTYVRINENPKMVENAYALNIPTYRKKQKNTQFGIWNVCGDIRTSVPWKIQKWTNIPTHQIYLRTVKTKNNT